MKTSIVDIFNNKTLTLPAFCDLMWITEKEMGKDLIYIESAYDETGVRVISIHHVSTMRYMLAWIERLLSGLDPDSREFAEFAQLGALLRIRITKILSLEQRVFNPSRHRGVTW